MASLHNISQRVGAPSNWAIAAERPKPVVEGDRHLKMKQTLLSFGLLAFSGLSVAYPPVDQASTDVNWLIHACNSSDSGSKFAEGFCKGYIEGVYSSISNWCVPADVSRERLQGLIIAELRIIEQTEGGRQSASQAIMRIISRRWPCD